MMALPKADQLTARRHPSVCSPSFIVKTQDLGLKWVDIGGLYSIGIAKAKAKMTYSEGAFTTIGIGVSVPFTNGSFQFDGTEAETKTGTQGFTPQLEPEENMQTKYDFVKVSVRFKGCRGSYPDVEPTAGTFSAGVDLKKEIGITLSAQSGYNQNVAIKLTMGKGGGYFCGSNDLAPKAHWVVMDQTQFGNPGPVAGRSQVKGQRASR